MRISNDGIALIKFYEGLRLKTYLCSAGVLTIGYGHTGPDVKAGMTISEQEADELLRKDLKRFEDGVESLVKVDLAEDEFSALVAFAFNVGLGNLKTSTLLRLLNNGDYSGAAAQFGRWAKAGGKTLPGLVKRRESESRMFQGLDWR